MSSRSKQQSNFKVDWLLVNELAIGPAPRTEVDLKTLKESGIKSILSLCSIQEAPPHEQMFKIFNCKRFVLPDHKAGRAPELSEFVEAMSILKETIKDGPLFVHCFAAVERSPLLCLAWIMLSQKINQKRALEYLMSVHPGTSPTAGQLNVVKEYADSKFFKI